MNATAQTDAIALCRLFILPMLSEPKALVLKPIAAGKAVQVKVSPHDVGRIIGRNGRTLRAVEHLLKIAEGPTLFVDDPPFPGRPVQRERDPNWTPDVVIAGLQKWADAAEIPGQFSAAEHGQGFRIITDCILDGETITAIARWASTVAAANGGRIKVNGAHYSDL